MMTRLPRQPVFTSKARFISAAFFALFCALTFSSVSIRAETDVTPPSSGKVFNATSSVLDNGLQLVVVENSRAPVVTHMVWYRVGAADEPAGSSGIAHFLEHLLFKGSKQIEGPDLIPGEFSRIVRGLGGNDNAFTSQDYTAYFQSVPSAHLETVMNMEAGRMRGAAFPEDEVTSERLVILEERRQRTDNNPQAQFHERMQAALYVNHPYGTPIIGWMHEMEGLSHSDAWGFYRAHYAPNNAILIVSGDVKADEVHALAQKTYGTIGRYDVPERTRISSPPLSGNLHIDFKDKAVQQPLFRRLYRVPSFRQDRSIALALEVLQEIFASGQSSRLYKSLVVEQELADSVTMSYSGGSWNDANLHITGIPKDGIDLNVLEQAIDAELQKLIDTPVTDDELRDAVIRMQDAAIYARDSLSGPAMTIGYHLITGSSLDDVEYWPDHIAQVTADDIQTAAQNFLNPDNVQTRFVSGYLEGFDD